MKMRENSPATRAQAQTEIQTMGRPSVCQCEIRTAQRLWRTALHCCCMKMEWRDMSRVRPATGSVLRKLYSHRGPLICVGNNRQLLFVIYILRGLAGMNYRVYFGLQ